MPAEVEAQLHTEEGTCEEGASVEERAHLSQVVE